MPFKRFTEIGRVAVVNYGKEFGQLLSIVDVVDQNWALVDAPDMARTKMNFKRLSLTYIKIDIPRCPKKKTLIAAWEAGDVKNKWEQSSWGRKLIVQKRRADRFKLMLAKIKRAGIVKQLDSVKMTEKEAMTAEEESFGKRSFGMGNGRSGDCTTEAPPQSVTIRGKIIPHEVSWFPTEEEDDEPELDWEGECSWEETKEEDDEPELDWEGECSWEESSMAKEQFQNGGADKFKKVRIQEIISEVFVEQLKVKEAVQFYETVFGAVVLEHLSLCIIDKHGHKDGEIPNASAVLKLGNAKLIVRCDVVENRTIKTGRDDPKVLLVIDEDIGRLIDKALNAGAYQVGGFTEDDAFPGKQLGEIRDPFGYVWTIAGIKSSDLADKAKAMEIVEVISVVTVETPKVESAVKFWVKGFGAVEVRRATSDGVVSAVLKLGSAKLIVKGSVDDQAKATFEKRKWLRHKMLVSQMPGVCFVLVIDGDVLNLLQQAVNAGAISEYMPNEFRRVIRYDFLETIDSAYPGKRLVTMIDPLYFSWIIAGNEIIDTSAISPKEIKSDDAADDNTTTTCDDDDTNTTCDDDDTTTFDDDDSSDFISNSFRHHGSATVRIVLGGTVA